MTSGTAAKAAFDRVALGEQIFARKAELGKTRLTKQSAGIACRRPGTASGRWRKGDNNGLDEQIPGIWKSRTRLDESVINGQWHAVAA
jgi:hypothetical protein